MKTVTDNNTIEQVLKAAWLAEGHNSLEEFIEESNWAVYECESSVQAELYEDRDDCYVVDKYVACF